MRKRGESCSRYLRTFEVDCLVWCEVMPSILYYISVVDIGKMLVDGDHYDR
jgi:hypothetical protein